MNKVKQHIGSHNMVLVRGKTPLGLVDKAKIVITAKRVLPTVKYWQYGVKYTTILAGIATRDDGTVIISVY